MNRINFALALLVAFVSGCSIPIVENPLVKPEECKSHPQLHGVFKTRFGDDKKLTHLHIGSAGEAFPPGFLQLIVVNQPDAKRPLTTTSFVGFAEEMSDSYIIHIPLPEEGGLEGQIERLGNKWDAEQIDWYLLLRLIKTDTGFKLFLLDEASLAKQIEAKQIAGRIEQGFDETTTPPTKRERTTRITASTAELRKYFKSTPLNKIFEDEGVLYEAWK